MPDCGEFNYMTHYFFESGIHKTGFNGVEPLTWSDVESFSNIVGLDEFESLCLFKMSKVYCNATLSMTKQTDAPPFVKDPEAVQAQYAAQLREKRIKQRETLLKAASK